MKSVQIKKWIGERSGWIAGMLFASSIALYAVAYLIEKGFTAISPATVVAAIATAFLLASVSVTVEQYVKANLTDREVASMLQCRELGIQQIGHRNMSAGYFSGLPPDLLAECHDEIVVLAYAADNFVERNREWITDSLANGLSIGIVMLHPDAMEQPNETEGRNLTPQIEKALNYCRQFVADEIPGIENLWIKGFAGHFYYTAILLDRHIVRPDDGYVNPGTVCVQMKANYQTQHKGVVVTFKPESAFSDYYSISCEEIWRRSEDLLSTR